MKSFRKKEIYLLAFLIFNTVLFTGIFYYDLHKNVNAGSNEDIGIITFKYNSIQRKYDSQIIWKNLFQNSLLKNRDTIRTYEESDAMVTLNDGTIIEIDENSLVYLDINKNKKNINFDAGSIQIKNKSKDFEIISNNKKINIGEGDFKLQQLENDELNFTVDKGNAKLDINGKTHDLSDSQIAKISKNDIEIKDLVFKLNYPENQKKVVISKSNPIVKFKWEHSKSYNNIKIVISKNRDFSNIIKSESATNSTNVGLSQGVYFWRIEGELNGKREVSQSQKVIVLEDSPIELLSPSTNEHINISHKKEIYFAWTVSSINSRYKLELSKSKDFTEIYKTVIVDFNSISISKIPKGTYFWRVKTIPLTKDSETNYSRISSFSTFENWNDNENDKDVKLNTKDAASALDPDSNEDLNKENNLSNLEVRPIDENSLKPRNQRIDVFKRKYIPFNWEKMENAKYYKFSIYNLKRKNKKVYQTKTKDNKLIFKKFSSLEVGKFKWEVAPIFNEKGENPPPSGAKFEILYKSSLRNLSPEDIEILSPETIYRD